MSKTNDATSPADIGKRRQQLIEQCLATLGRAWAASCCQEMSLARRNIEGGWPGRLAEAKTLVMRELARELGEQGMAPPSPSELVDAPATVNEHARNAWLQTSKAQRLAQRSSRTP